MNAKLLFFTTLALSIASTLAVAQEARPLSRADVVAEFQRARADGTLHRTDYDDEKAATADATPLRRDQVIAQLSAKRDPRLIGPLRSGSYNPYGAEILRAPLARRADVKSDVIEARRTGTLRRTDYDDEATPRAPKRRAVVGPVLAAAPAAVTPNR